VQVAEGGQEVLVTDLDSTNGTMVNDKQLLPLEAVRCVPGDTVIFGDEHLACFRIEELPDDVDLEGPPSARASGVSVAAASAASQTAPPSAGTDRHQEGGALESGSETNEEEQYNRELASEDY
jgi:pSer/pThr/pTyr-binding forkhead associated (FHA) protein